MLQFLASSMSATALWICNGFRHCEPRAATMSHRTVLPSHLSRTNFRTGDETAVSLCEKRRGMPVVSGTAPARERTGLEEYPAHARTKRPLVPPLICPGRHGICTTSSCRSQFFLIHRLPRNGGWAQCLQNHHQAVGIATIAVELHIAWIVRSSRCCHESRVC
jgi:hypothetical protein